MFININKFRVIDMKRNNAKYSRLVLLLIIISLFLSALSGCNKKTDGNSDKISDYMYETVTNVYRTVNIDLPVNFVYSRIFTTGERVYFTGYLMDSYR